MTDLRLKFQVDFHKCDKVVKLMLVMYSELKDKVALVTGASRGFGRAIALRLADEGCRVIVNYRRSKTEAEEVLQEIAQRGGEGIAIRADIGNPEKTAAMMEVIQSEYGRIDILIANASFGMPGNLMDASAKYWDATMNATARSLLMLAQLSAPFMDGWGRIVTVSSYGGQKVLPGYGVVGPAKSAVEGLTRSLAVELADKGILVNGVMPGISDTKSLRAIPGVDDVLDRAVRSCPSKRLVTGEEVANVVSFLCSNQASMICGQFIIIDGGTFIMG